MAKKLRIDKILSNLGYGSRAELKVYCKKGMVKVNDKVISNPGTQVDTDVDKIEFNNEVVNYREFVYIMMNKPDGYLSATFDKRDPIVLDLIDSSYLAFEPFPVGRLDKNTTGLMIITDDGKFAHNILAPKKHVSKKYEVIIDIPVTKEMKKGFEEGIELIDGKCKSSSLIITGKYTAEVTLTEGRYHQIKRMFGCYGAKVTKLHRTQMGKLKLPKDLEVGKARELTPEEMEKLCQTK